jgi:hypothetical protein
MRISGESTEEETEGIGDQMLYFAFRVPKKNHDAMVQGAKKKLMNYLGNWEFIVHFSSLTI